MATEPIPQLQPRKHLADAITKLLSHGTRTVEFRLGSRFDGYGPAAVVRVGIEHRGTRYMGNAFVRVSPMLKIPDQAYIEAIDNAHAAAQVQQLRNG